VFHFDGPIGPVPAMVEDHADAYGSPLPGLNTWVNAAARYFVAGDGAGAVRVELVPAMRELLAEQMHRAGHSTARAQQVAPYVFRDAGVRP
jgi:hypothetical protein